MDKLVSVIIATYNRREAVVEAVESVLAQTYRPIELMVVDDGSTDGTEAALRAFGERLRYRVQQNRGPSAARNLGIRETTGELIAFLDSDDLWAPTKLAKQVARLAAAPEVGVVYCAFHQLDLITGASGIVPCRPDVRGDIRRKLLHRSWVPPSAAMVRRACFDRVGLFDETLWSAEDWELWIRVSRHFHFDYVDEPLMTLRSQGDNLTKKIASMHRYQMQVIERAFRTDPIDGRNRLLRRSIVARFHFDTGEEFLQRREFGAAARHLLTAAALWPFQRRYYLYLARAILRRPVREALRAVPGAPCPVPGQQDDRSDAVALTAPSTGHGAPGTGHLPTRHRALGTGHGAQRLPSGKQEDRP